ncbi:hypothetical protein A0256_10615 [Mucilaginibacter sp. PAMC 26640]|nr:hypothetical protein A0256_10615 [Mucilaginibacter sp. PAMC 26640]
MRFIYSIFIVATLIFLTSCSYKQSHVLFENKTNVNAANDSVLKNTFPVQSTYHIQPRDILQIKNLQNIKYIVDDVPTNTSASGNASAGQTFEVEEDGTVALPVIGRIAVSGLTRIEATRKIEELYRKDLLKNPILDIRITNLKVTIFGEVAAQGNYPILKENTTLVEMLGQAGGLMTTANEKNIKIIRGAGQYKTVALIDLSDINSISDPRSILQNGDVIYVSQNKRAVRNDKLSNLTSLIQPALILLNTALIIITLTR